MVEEVIEDVVKFQHGGLNNSVDTMSDVMKEYTHGRSDIQGLRKSLNETQSVLTSKKSGQIPLKDLWLKKVELQETLRIVKELESLKVQYISTVAMHIGLDTLNTCVIMFCDCCFLPICAERPASRAALHATEEISVSGGTPEQSHCEHVQ